MFGTTGILIALIVLTIALALVFLVRSTITVGVTGKILAFVGLCVLPVLCIGTGWSVHQQRSEQTSSCIACHSMETHGKSLYVADRAIFPRNTFKTTWCRRTKPVIPATPTTLGMALLRTRSRASSTFICNM